MGARARAAQVALASVLLTMGAVSSGACGLSVTATGDGPGDGSIGAVPTGTGNPGSGGDAGGDASQGDDCTTTTCGTLCTDTQTDPQNCGGCGNDCGAGKTCEKGGCTILCDVDEKKCGETCIDPQTDPASCGVCGKACNADELCSAGSCRTDCGTLHRCPEDDAGAPGGGTDAGAQYCADLTRDRNNCGACNVKCNANEVCTGSACKALCGTGSTIADTFGTPVTMVGCLGKVGFDQRASLCPGGAHVCTAQEWVARRAGKAPTFNYWTNDDLGWAGRDGNCSAERSGGYSCRRFQSDPRQPMRVCASGQDGLGNRCNYTGCGLDTNSPNQFFGGCQGNPTASTLCCN